MVVLNSDLPVQDEETISQLLKPEPKSLGSETISSKPVLNSVAEPSINLLPFPKQRVPITDSDPSVETLLVLDKASRESPTPPQKLPEHSEPTGSKMSDADKIPGSNVIWVDAEASFRCNDCKEFVDVQYVLMGNAVYPACNKCFLDKLAETAVIFGDAEDIDDMDSIISEAVGDGEEDLGDLGYTG